MPPKAKGKIRVQHQRAIEEFLEWQRKHPHATHQQTFDAFDRFVDSAQLEEILNHAA
jgi:hypothetical protein